MAERISSLPWIEDGIESGEFNAVRGLILLVNEGYSANLIEEPWVVEGRNYPALEALWVLEAGNPEAVSRIMSHPTISDGISDQEAKIIATLHTVDFDQLDKLLDLEQVTLEERTITLPMAGKTELTIIRTRPGTNHAMDSLEHSVRSIEEFMGLPFPRRQVIYLFDDALDDVLGQRGRNYFTHVSIRTSEEGNSKESTLTLFAHEAGHYYRLGYAPWVREGAAHIAASVADNTLHGPLISLSCPQSRSIAEFEDWERNSPYSGETHQCRYSLGERLFRDLHRNMDETAFRQAFRRLHLRTTFDVPDDECDDNNATDICSVMEAFITYAPEETAPTVERVIARWYDVPEPYDLSHVEDTPVNPEIAAIDGRIEEAYLSIFPGGLPVSVLIVGPNRNPGLNLNLDYSYGHHTDSEFLPIDIELYLDDGSEIQRMLTELEVLPVPAGSTWGTHTIHIPFWRDTGRYWVQAYSGEQKIVEVTFETVPEPDPHSIRGAVTYTGGQPLEGIALSFKQGEESFWVETGMSGTFDVEVSPGSFIVEVKVLIDNNWHFAGWYDGAGITNDPTQASNIIVDDADVEGIEIIFSADTYPHSIQGVVTDTGGQPLQGIGLWAIQGEEWLFDGETGADGVFDVVVSSGSFILQVFVPDGSVRNSVGWYDGSGGITTDRSQAFEVVVDDADIEGIEIKLPTQP